MCHINIFNNRIYKYIRSIMCWKRNKKDILNGSTKKQELNWIFSFQRNIFFKCKCMQCTMHYLHAYDIQSNCLSNQIKSLKSNFLSVQIKSLWIFWKYHVPIETKNNNKKQKKGGFCGVLCSKFVCFHGSQYYIISKSKFITHSLPQRQHYRRTRFVFLRK